jgi:hypothetical protein
MHVNTKISAGKYCSSTTFGYTYRGHSLQTEFKEETFIGKYHAAPSKIHRFIEEL